MVEFDAFVRKSGTSMVVTFPVRFQKLLDLRIGELVRVAVKKKVKREGFGLLTGIGLPSFEREHVDRV